MKRTTMEELIVKSSVDINLINMQSLHSPKELVENCISGYFNQIEDLVNDIQNRPNIKVILLSGPSSSGKTTTANLIKQNLEKINISANVISMDDFFINRDVTPKLADGSYDYENITTVDLPCFKKFLNEILTNSKSMMPKFNFVTGKRDRYEMLQIKKGGILIIEGIHALNPIIINNHEDELYRVYVCLNTNFCIDNKVVLEAKKLRRIRRAIRDFYTRGMTIQQTIKIWKNVCAGEDKFIKPFKNNANFLIDSTHNFEPLIYKKYLPRLLDNSNIAKEFEDELKFLCEMDISYLPEKCLLWEFLEGVKKYS